ncbi:hypothetical protein [Actinoplanes sp. URMC 104]|uniref:hypothetical protein n=1 Tax=Actinoplanes sp. URMC 104 TaxID=3423409 RepID=UPI003F19F5A6
MRRHLLPLLLLPALAGLAACGDDEPTAAAPAPAATTATSAAPAATGEVTRAPSGGGASDATLCKQAEAAMKTFTRTIGASLDSNGDIPAAASKKAFGDLATTLEKLAASGAPGSTVTTEAQAFAVEVKQVAGEPDPFAASEKPGFGAAGDKFEQTCKTVK